MVGRNSFGIWGGIILIGLGVVFLLGQALQVDIWGFLWPLIIIAVGALFFAGMLAGGRSMGGLAVPGSIISMVGLILLVQNIFGIWETWSYAWTLIVTSVGIGLSIFGVWSNLPELRRVGRLIIVIGLVLFVVFGVFFGLGAALFGMRSQGGVFWAVALILAGLYFLFGQNWLRQSAGPVRRSEVPLGAPSSVGHTPIMEQTPFVIEDQAVGEAENLPVLEVHEEQPLSGIRRVRFRSVGDMTILQGEREGLEIEANEAMRERIRAEVLGDVLEIRFDNDWLFWLNPRYWNPDPVRYKVYVRNLEGLEVAGLGRTIIPQLSTRRLELLQSGAGDISIRGMVIEEIAVRLAGLGNIQVEGQAAQQDITISGAGNYQADRLESSMARVHLTGLGNATVRVRQDLDARVSGAGNVEYYGSPRVSQTVTGLGNVRQLGSR